MRAVLSAREGRLSSAALLRRLGNESERNRIRQTYRELGRVMRTIVLLRFLPEPEQRESIQAMTNKVEAFHKFSNWLMFASDVLQDNDPDQQEKTIKSTSCWRTASIFHTAVDITKLANDLMDDGWEVDPATVTPYITARPAASVPVTSAWSRPRTKRLGGRGWPPDVFEPEGRFPQPEAPSDRRACEPAIRPSAAQATAPVWSPPRQGSQHARVCTRCALAHSQRREAC
ncbi:Tn3 family transposase [Streptomyces asiaticus]